MICAKYHESEGKSILALCDSTLMDKEFEEGKFYLKTSKTFYDGNLDEEEITKKIDQVYIINAVGEESINFLKSKGIVIECTSKIKGILHAEIVIIRD